MQIRPVREDKSNPVVIVNVRDRQNILIMCRVRKSRKKKKYLDSFL